MHTSKLNLKPCGGLRNAPAALNAHRNIYKSLWDLMSFCHVFPVLDVGLPCESATRSASNTVDARADFGSSSYSPTDPTWESKRDF